MTPSLLGPWDGSRTLEATYCPTVLGFGAIFDRHRAGDCVFDRAGPPSGLDAAACEDSIVPLALL